MTKPPDARAVNPGQQVTYHGSTPSAVVRILDDLEADDVRFTRRVLSVLASPEGQAAIRAAMVNPLVGRRCRVNGDTFTVVHVDWDGSLLVRGDAWAADWQPLRLSLRLSNEAEWIDETGGAQ